MSVKYSDEVFQGKVCPYCGNRTEIIDSSEIYNGASYGKIHICRACDAYVGCHKNSEQALGMIANAELRTQKKMAHHFFDQLWQNKAIFKSRYNAYSWLSRHLGIPRQYTHIGMSDVEQCQKIIELSVSKMSSFGITPLPYGNISQMTEM